MAVDVYKDWLGIPDGPRPPDYYQLLRLVQFEDNVEKIRKNYKKLNTHVRKYASGAYSSESQDLLNELAKAMLCLTDLERKRDYDRGLGRIVDDRDQLTGRRPLASYLLDNGILTAAQVNDATQFADKLGISMRDALVQKKLVAADVAAQALSLELELPYVDLADVIPENYVLDRVPRQLVRKYSIIPLFIDDDAVLIACGDEPPPALEDEIRLRMGMPMRAAIAVPRSIEEAIKTYYAAGKRQEIVETSSSAKAATSKPVVAKSGPLTPEEKKQRVQIGYISIFLLITLLVNLDSQVLWAMLWRHYGIPGFFPFVATTIIGVPAAALIFLGLVQPNSR